MFVREEDVNYWRAFLQRLSLASVVAQTALREHNEPEVQHWLHYLQASAQRLGMKMEQAGAERPSELPPLPELSLDLLDTPANRRYLEALRVAHTAALAVDRERGWDADGPAGLLEDLLRNVEMEVHGPGEEHGDRKGPSHPDSRQHELE